MSVAPIQKWTEGNCNTTGNLYIKIMWNHSLLSLCFGRKCCYAVRFGSLLAALKLFIRITLVYESRIDAQETVKKYEIRNCRTFIPETQLRLCTNPFWQKRFCFCEWKLYTKAKIRLRWRIFLDFHLTAS